MAGHTETYFERAVEHRLVKSGGYSKAKPSVFDEGLALFPTDVVGFLQDSQAERSAQLKKLLGDSYAIVTISNPAYPLELFQTVITARLEAMEIVKELSKLEFDG